LDCADLAAQAIAAAGLAPRQAARQAGIPPARLGRQLAGRAAMALGELAALAGALGIAPAALVPG
jgi:hypothetical protein